MYPALSLGHCNPSPDNLRPGLLQPPSGGSPRFGPSLPEVSGQHSSQRGPAKLSVRHGPPSSEPSSPSEQKPKTSQRVGGLRVPLLSLLSRLTGLLAVPEMHQERCQLRACAHAVPVSLMHFPPDVSKLLSLPSGCYSSAVWTGRSSWTTSY